MDARLQDHLPAIAALLRAQIPAVRAWPEKRLEQWLTWYATRELLGIVTRDGKVVAAGVARPVHAGQETETYAVDEQGDTIWIDGAVAVDRAATRALWVLLLRRLGRRAWVGYHRAKHGGRARREPFDRFLNRFFRLS